MAPKRKRGNTTSNQPPTISIDSAAPVAQQPSSRDASDEDAHDPVLAAVKQKLDSSNDSGPSAKRSRTDLNAADNGDGDDDVRDAEAIRDALEHGEGGERGTLKMEDPPKAGLVHPKGYKTNPPPEGRPVRIYADGVFDLFHLGHMRQLQQAKQAFPEVYLIVGVTGDKETHRRKGLTVLSGRERAESVRHCKWVDEVVEDCPWIIADAPEFIKKYEIDYIAHDDIPYGADEGDDIYAPIKEAGKFLVTQRTEGVSTTGIITKIVRDYDKYIARQLQRGTPRQELNVSWLKKNELDIKQSMSELRESIRTNWTTTGQELGRELKQFWQASRPSSPAPSGRSERRSVDGRRSGATSPTAVSHLSHLDIPKSGAQNGGQSSSADFAAGYSLGLVGGVRAWMTRRRHTLNDPRADSESSDESPASPDEDRRGRQRPGSSSAQEQVDAQLKAETSK